MYYYFLSSYFLYKFYRNYYIFEDIRFLSKSVYTICRYIYKYIPKYKDVNQEEWVVL